MNNSKNTRTFVERSWDALSIEKLEEILDNMRGPKNKRKLNRYLNDRMQNTS